MKKVIPFSLSEETLFLHVIIAQLRILVYFLKHVFHIYLFFLPVLLCMMMYYGLGLIELFHAAPLFLNSAEELITLER